MDPTRNVCLWTFKWWAGLAGNAVPLCHVFFADKAGYGHLTHHPIYCINTFTPTYIIYSTYITYLTYLFYSTY